MTTEQMTNLGIFVAMCTMACVIVRARDPVIGLRNSVYALMPIVVVETLRMFSLFFGWPEFAVVLKGMKEVYPWLITLILIAGLSIERENFDD